MDRRSVITSLKALRMELEDCHIVADMPEAALVLSDVCACLGFSKAETAEVLGGDVAEAVEEWATSRLWQPVEVALRQAQDAETAAVPTPELAAVPV